MSSKRHHDATVLGEMHLHIVAHHFGLSRNIIASHTIASEVAEIPQKCN